MEPLRKTFMKDVLDASRDTILDNITCEATDVEEGILALLIQNNLLLDKLCNLLFIATGLDAHDIPDDIANTNIDIEKVGHTICSQCNKGVAPNRMGYCPKCGNDLKLQIARESLSKG